MTLRARKIAFDRDTLGAGTRRRGQDEKRAEKRSGFEN
jgi:hypothetical protein